MGHNFTSKNVTALQAADFLVWEFRKHHEKIAGSLDIVSEILNADEAWTKQEQWIFNKYGSHEASIRKSAAALFDESNEFYPLVWDYRMLNAANETRNGIWRKL